MKKHQKIVCLATAAVLALSGASIFAGCANQEGDPETRPFIMAIQQPDGVFNPFFSTSQYDTNILSWTQLAMFSTDKSGNLTAGENEACVVKAWSSSYSATEDDKMNDGVDEGVTTYQLAIKNGIKFSDGEPLTIKDVLFNLYVYLDPAYTGSSTIYSTKFVGLEAYRTGDEKATEGTMDNLNAQFEDSAKARINTLRLYVQDHGIMSHKPDPQDWPSLENEYHEKLEDIAKADYAKLRELFRESLETDWNTFTTDMESYKKDWGFTEVWQPFLYFSAGQTGMRKLDEQQKPVKGPNGNYLFDPDAPATKELEGELAEYLEEHTEGTVEARTRTWAIAKAFRTYFNPDDDDKTVEQQIANTYVSDFELVSNKDYSSAGYELFTYVTASEKTKYFKNVNREVTSVSGITTFKASQLTGTPGGNSSLNLGEECDILQVKVRGVDPKALWNLSYNVAPMHYYSSKEYIDAFDAATGNFGLPFSDIDFLNSVVNAPSKVGLPVGAGAYMASSSGGTPATSGSQFFPLDRIYYERNPYFETVGSGIKNAKIKYMQYKVVQQDQIINSLITGEIDYGDPSATQDNIRALNDKGIAHEEYMTSGYGYVGINPRYVKSIVVRRAIIKAMNTSLIFSDYYQGGLAEPIYRSMSKANWAYPEGATAYVSKNDNTSYAFNPNDPNGDEIVNYLKGNGCSQNSSGKFVGPDGEALAYTFTIAGSSTDHPAYRMFIEAAQLLNSIGFEITVQQSQTALSDLTTGKLTVWAAAWTSTIDPDMYQVYHKDSTATSVNNWGYPQMRADTTTYGYEWGIVATNQDTNRNLSALIEAGRKTEDQTERKEIYAKALDLVMELAVEYPTYQRKDMFAYTGVLDRSTMSAAADCGPYYGLLFRIWELNYN